MDNLITLPIASMNNGDNLKVKFQLSQLIKIYGQTCVDNAIHGQTYNIIRVLECQRHVENLMLTFGTVLVMKQFGLLTQKVKAG